MEIQRLMRRAAAAVAVSALILLAGPTNAAQAAPTGEGSSAAVIGPGAGVVITVTGVVTEGVEFGCRILVPLTGNGGSGYLLLGGPPLKMGGTYRVTGEIRNVATTCQQGTPLAVLSAVPV